MFLGVTTFSIQTIRLALHNFVVCVFAEVGFDYFYWDLVLISCCDCFQFIVFGCETNLKTAV